jgi:hypothetical protein
MPDTVVEAPTYTQTKQEVLDKLQSHIDAVAELKDKLATFDDASGMPLKIAFMVASAYDEDPHISIQVGSSFNPILFGQVLATACSVNPHTVLGLMEGLAASPDTRDAMSAAILSMIETLRECGDAELAFAEPEGSA